MYLVTGGAGFIGSNLVEHLVSQGEAVRVLDNFATGKRENLQAIDGDFELVEADIRDLEAIRPAFEGVDWVLHQAAVPSVPRSVDDPVTSHHANVTGTLNVLLAARDAGVRRVVAASSSSVYGSNPVLPKREDMLPMPLSPYAASKLAGEAYARAFGNVYGLEVVCLRYFNVFGPRQDPTSQYSAVIPRFITALLAERKPTIFGDGEQTRDFTYVDNVVQANLRAAKAEGQVSGAYNIACGERASLNDLVRELKAILGSDVEPEYGPPRAGDVRDSLADTRAAREAFGYEPAVDFAEGLRRTVEWYQAQTG